MMIYRSQNNIIYEHRRSNFEFLTVRACTIVFVAATIRVALFFIRLAITFILVLTLEGGGWLTNAVKIWCIPIIYIAHDMRRLYRELTRCSCLEFQLLMIYIIIIIIIIIIRLYSTEMVNMTKKRDSKYTDMC